MTVNQDQKILDSILRMGRTFRKRGHYHIRKMELSPLQVHTLFFIKDKQPVAMHELAKNFQITKPTATSIIDVLIKNRYVDRINDSKDRRITRISLTAKGERYLSKALGKKIQACLNC